MPKTPAETDAAEAQIRERQKDVDYQIREYPVEVVVHKHLEGREQGLNEIFVPDYQRDLVWPEEHQSRFIESLLIGLPIPYLFVADVGADSEDLSGRLEIVDGTQRIRTIARFLSDEFELQGLKKLTALNGFRFSDLPASRQRRFRRITLRLIELTEQADEETRVDMFDRINSSALGLNPMETRRGTHRGPFIKLVEELAADPRFATLAPISPARAKRFEREELVARFFAFCDGYEKFGTPEVGKVVTDFIDAYSERMNKKMTAEGKGGGTELELRVRWDSVMNFVGAHFPNGFTKSSGSKSTPRVRFDAIAVGSWLALNKEPGLVPQNVVDWLSSEEFREQTGSDAANNRERVIGRIEYVRDALLGG